MATTCRFVLLHFGPSEIRRCRCCCNSISKQLIPCSSHDLCTPQGKTASLCVRRSLFTDDTGAEDPDKKGICSNFLCDAKPGDEVMLTGPAGKALLLPATSPEADIILVATGTGVASYRCNALCFVNFCVVFLCSLIQTLMSRVAIVVN